MASQRWIGLGAVWVTAACSPPQSSPAPESSAADRDRGAASESVPSHGGATAADTAAEVVLNPAAEVVLDAATDAVSDTGWDQALGIAPEAIAVPAGASWLGIAGGAEPASTQVSMEQDMALAREVLGPEGIVLFAGGTSVPAVQVASGPRVTDIRARLGALFDFRGGLRGGPWGSRDAHYRRPQLAVAGAATATNAAQVLGRLTGAEGPPLLLYVGGHGVLGQRPADTQVLLWGGWPFTVPDLADILDRAQRPVRVVMTTCHSGGFAEIAFAGARSDRGAAATPRCGLFATSWDEVASGCDPNPDRAAQQGYGMHFLHALAGRDRAGRPLPAGTVDIDGDGAISLMEAHTRARIASQSIDRPQTTSERWLRHALEWPITTAVRAGRRLPRRSNRAPRQRRRGREDSQAWRAQYPEEHAVVTQLGRALDIVSAEAAQTRLRELDQHLKQQEALLVGRQADLDNAYAHLRIQLLARWPILDDPWHPEFVETLARDAAAVAAVLDNAPAAHAYARAQSEFHRAAVVVDDLLIQHAMVSRVLRAWESVYLAQELERRGGAPWTNYRALLACERTPP